MEPKDSLRRSPAGAVFDAVLGAGMVAASAILAFLMLTVFLDVVLRNTGNDPLPWALEYVQYGLLFMTFLGTGYVLKKESHVCLDIVLSKLSHRHRHFIEIINSIVCAVISLLLAYFSLRLCVEQFKAHSYQPTPMETPDFIVFGVIPLGTFLLTIQFFRRAFNHFLLWKRSG